MAGRDWEVAGDLPGRLMELCGVLGDTPEAFTKRFGRARKQYYAWKKGDQLPGPSALETAAENNGWPLEIFETGGRRPKEAINRGVNVQGRGKVAKGVREPRAPVYGPPAREIIDRLDVASLPPEKLREFAALEVNDARTRREAIDYDRILWWVERAYEAGQRAAVPERPAAGRGKASGGAAAGGSGR